ncbi:CPBP family intramembrane glutamic endopeptidase [Allosalinactinospora lopnorensis]|uniref:CPBP family intramembrane glutamic endopeptidase n=1 Tax=Allosalinactinospora lopnorensis TaxID=1352348 RepID=UPI000696967F|nr:type II CAAX endopeptidase family protein [Allosalinactinospora lopnorensis]
MARTWRYRWWVPLLSVLCAVVLIVLVQIAMGIAALLTALVAGLTPDPEADSIFGAPLPDLAFTLIALSTMTPLVMFVVRFVQRRPVGTLFSVEGRLRWRWMLICGAVSAVPLAVSFAVMYGLQRATAPESEFVGAFNPESGFALALLVILLLVPFQASAEEFALRGFLMQAIGAYGAGPGERRGSGVVARVLRSPVPGILVSGSVFTLMHEYTDWAMLDVAVFGIAMAWLTWYTGGLEAAVALHVLHNLVVFTITAYEGRLEDAATGSGSWQGVSGTFVEVVLYSFIVVWLARRMGVRRTVPDEAADHEEPPPQTPLPAWASQPSPYPYGQYGRQRAAPQYDPYHERWPSARQPVQQRYETGAPAPGGWVQPPANGPHSPPSS